MSLRLTKPSAQKRLHEIPRYCWPHGSATHTENVHVIVLHTLSRREVVMNQSSPDALDFVCAYRRAHAASTNRHTAIYFPSSDRFRERDHVVGIIVAFGKAMRTKI